MKFGKAEVREDSSHAANARAAHFRSTAAVTLAAPAFSLLRFSPHEFTAAHGLMSSKLQFSHLIAQAASSPCFASGSNGQEETMDKDTNDLFVSVRDRKVRISDGASIYALCRSWLRNDFSEGSQLQYGDFIKSLPKPSPMPMSESSLLKRKENDDETEIKEDENRIEDLSTKELLKRHIKRAKRVRARFREERLQRIARYKSRLALLLPPVMEQCGNDTSTGT